MIDQFFAADKLKVKLFSCTLLLASRKMCSLTNDGERHNKEAPASVLIYCFFLVRQNTIKSAREMRGASKTINIFTSMKSKATKAHQSNAL